MGYQSAGGVLIDLQQAGNGIDRHRLFHIAARHGTVDLQQQGQFLLGPHILCRRRGGCRLGDGAGRLGYGCRHLPVIPCKAANFLPAQRPGTDGHLRLLQIKCRIGGNRIVRRQKQIRPEPRHQKFIDFLF